MHNATTNLDDRYLQKETVDAIENLVTATESDRDAIAQLTATTARLTTELLTVNTNFIVALQTNRVRRSGRGRRDRTTRGGGSGSGEGAGTGTGSGAQERTGASAPTITEERDLEPPIHYCWTCGPGCRHNSAKCPVTAAGHIYKDTKRNMKGGT